MNAFDQDRSTVKNDVTDVKLWGEIDGCQNSSESIVFPTAVPASVTCHIPALGFPRDNVIPSSRQAPAPQQMLAAEPHTVLHALQLQVYVSKMQQLLAEAHSKMETTQFGELELPPAMKMPSRYVKKPASRSHERKSHGPHKRLSVQEGEGLGPAAVHVMLRRAVAMVCALIGYENSSDRALDVLTSILTDFLKRLCSHLRYNSDQKKSLPNSLNTVDQSLLDCRIGGREAIKQYWEQGVLAPTRQLADEAETLQREYSNLLEPTTSIKPCSPLQLTVPSSVAEHPAQLYEEELSLESMETQQAVELMETPNTPFKSPEFGAFHHFSEHMSETDMSFVPMRGITLLPRKSSRSTSSSSLL